MRQLEGTLLAGKYRVHRILPGPGGQVHEGVAKLSAEHASIQREVEVKILLEPSDAAQARLYREARALGQVPHAALRSVLDSGQDAQGRPFVVYEALEGETLARRMERYPNGMPTEEAASIAMQILEGLRALHRGGVVARGLSPECIAFTRTTSGEVAKIASLDRAAFLGEPDTEPVRFSPWAAPEVRRAGGEVGVEADVYSAGVMLRHLLTGRPQAGGPLPDTAARALQRATAEDPDERFPTVDVLMSCVALLLPTNERPPRDRMALPTDALAADIHWLALRRRTRHGTIDAAPADAPVHLMAALVTIEAIYRRVGRPAWTQLVEAVPAVEDLLPGAGNTSAHLRTGVWASILAEVLERADAIAGAGDLALVSEIGAAVAQRSLRRLCPDLPATLSPTVLVDAFPYLWSRIARAGRGVVLDRAPGQAKLAIEDTTPPLEIVGLTAAIVRAALFEAGGEQVGVAIVACSALGDRRDLLLARWASRASMPPRA
ncbi:MAG: protein kinase [Sandaracinus sp.]